MKLLVRAVRAVLDFIDPPLTITDVLGPNPLADAEEQQDTWDANDLKCRCFAAGWEDQLHDAVYNNDDDDELAPPPASHGGAHPAGTAPTPSSGAVPAGTPLHPAVILSRTLRDLGFPIPAAASECLALELSHYWQLTPKSKNGPGGLLQQHRGQPTDREER